MPAVHMSLEYDYFLSAVFEQRTNRFGIPNDMRII